MFEFPLLFLRCLFAGFQSHSSRIWRCGINWRCSNANLANPNSAVPTDCFGLAYGAFGLSGKRLCCSSNPRPSLPGIAWAFACSGAGNPELALEDPPWIGISSR